MLPEVLQTVVAARHSLATSTLPHAMLAAMQAVLEASIAAGCSVPREVRFIPNDVAQCAEHTVINCSHSDFALDIPSGYAIEASGAGPRSFAKPYYIDPSGPRRCRGLCATAVQPSRDHRCRSLDVLFIGHRGHPRPRDCNSLLEHPAGTRFEFLAQLDAHADALDPYRIRLVINPDNFFSRTSDADRAAHNARVGYVASMNDTRFVLCPRGRGRNSIRFFESIAVGAVPIYVGDEDTTMPLDWLINWRSLVPWIACTDVERGRAVPVLLHALQISEAERLSRADRLFELYWQFLAPSRKALFEQLVLLEASTRLAPTRELLQLRALLARCVSAREPDFDQPAPSSIAQ